MANEPYRHAEALQRDTDEERARSALARDLTQGEELLWAGRPKQGICFSPSDILMIPFSVVWGGFAIAWEIFVIWTLAPFFFWLWGVPFVAIGLYLMVGRFFMDARVRSRTFYGVTNRRALILVWGVARKLTSIDLANSVEVSLEERSDGRGNVALGRQGAGAFLQNPSWPGTRKLRPPTLWQIVDARGVFNTIQGAQAALRSKPPRDEMP